MQCRTHPLLPTAAASALFFALVGRRGAAQVIGDHVELGALCTIDRGSWRDTEIAEHVKLDNQARPPSAVPTALSQQHDAAF